MGLVARNLFLLIGAIPDHVCVYFEETYDERSFAIQVCPSWSSHAPYYFSYYLVYIRHYPYKHCGPIYASFCCPGWIGL